MTPPPAETADRIFQHGECHTGLPVNFFRFTVRRAVGAPGAAKRSAAGIVRHVSPKIGTGGNGEFAIVGNNRR